MKKGILEENKTYFICNAKDHVLAELNSTSAYINFCILIEFII